MASKGFGIDGVRWDGWELGEGVPLTLKGLLGAHASCWPATCWISLMTSFTAIAVFSLIESTVWAVPSQSQCHPHSFDHPEVTMGGLPTAARGKSPGLQTTSEHRFSLT